MSVGGRLEADAARGSPRAAVFLLTAKSQRALSQCCFNSGSASEIARR